MPTSVDFGEFEIVFPALYRRQEILNPEAYARYGFPIRLSGEPEISYQFEPIIQQPLVLSEFTKWHSLERMLALDPELDQNRWLVIHCHLSASHASAYVEKVLGSMIENEYLYEIESYTSPEGPAYSLTTLIAPPEGPFNSLIYKHDQRCGSRIRTLSATFGPASSFYDEDNHPHIEL